MTPENNSNQNVIKIHYSSLPLCCMGDKVSSHPKVYLPIENKTFEQQSIHISLS